MEDKAKYLLHLVGQLEFRPWAIPSINKWATQKKTGCLGVYRIIPASFFRDYNKPLLRIPINVPA